MISRDAWILIAPIIFLIGVSGCATEAELAQERARVDANIQSQCLNYGFKQGTDAFASCKMQRYADLENQQREAAMQQQFFLRANQLQQQREREAADRKRERENSCGLSASIAANKANSQVNYYEAYNSCLAKGY